MLSESHPSLLSLSFNFYNHCLCSIHDTLIRAQMEPSLHIQSTYHICFDFLENKQQSEVMKNGERSMEDSPECQHYYLSGLHYQYYSSSFSIDRKNNYMTSMLFELMNWCSMHSISLKTGISTLHGKFKTTVKKYIQISIVCLLLGSGVQQ